MGCVDVFPRCFCFPFSFHPRSHFARIPPNPSPLPPRTSQTHTGTPPILSLTRSHDTSWGPPPFSCFPSSPSITSREHFSELPWPHLSIDLQPFFVLSSCEANGLVNTLFFTSSSVVCAGCLRVAGGHAGNGKWMQRNRRHEKATKTVIGEVAGGKRGANDVEKKGRLPCISPA